MGHEDTDHDPVSHLDLDHVDSHPHDKNESKTAKECKDKKATKAIHKNHPHHHVHNATYHSHNSSHHNHTASHVSLDGKTDEALNGTNTTLEQNKKKTRKHKERRKGAKTSEVTVDSQLDFEHAQDENKLGYNPDHNHAESLRSNVDADNLESEEHKQGSEYLQRNTRKREAPNHHTTIKTHTRSHTPHDDKVHEHDEVSAGQCFWMLP
ncbi:zinc transporter ZIP10-like [Bufo gargarizans]|uniref:zinc transporter ZIP10-like n=1 Tax=Bufo gargarizans TaxID=30331 RepID=UPI001CF1CD98|nr:zinc transporter ZIP10-like [Bufo gargarizans]